MTHLFLTRDQQGVHTQTRFVMPFRYELPEGASSAPYPCFKEEDPERHHGRQSYFMPETAKVLFHRARWLKLQWPENSKDLRSWTFKYWNCGPTLVRASIEAVQLVLFEFGLDPASKGFRHGFLLLDVCLDSHGNPALDEPESVAPEILANFNEVYRYWSPPFPEVLTARGFRDYAVLGPNAPQTPDAFQAHWMTWLQHPICLSAKDEGAPEPKERTYLLKAAALGQADSRAFVWTAASTAEDEDGVRMFTGGGTSEEQLRKCGALVKLLNVDPWRGSYLGSFPGQPSEFEREWLKGRLYLRWAEFGSVYGFSPHSGLLLCARTSEPPIVNYFFSLHFDQALLLLYVKIMTFSFSERLSEMSGQAADQVGCHEAKRKLGEQFTNLRYEFALFTNMYQFPLLSSQQQGVEMYALQRTALDIDDLFREIKEEIETTDEFLRNDHQARQTQEATDLTKEAAVLGEQAMTLNIVAFVGLALSLTFAALEIEQSPAWAWRWPGLLGDVFDHFGNLLLAVFGVCVLLLVALYGRANGYIRTLLTKTHLPPGRPPTNTTGSNTNRE